MPPRFVRSPESGLRPRTGILVPGPTSTPIIYQGPRTPTFTGAASQSVMSSPADKMVRLGLTPQQQQLLLQRQQLQQQRQALIQQQQELSQVLLVYKMVFHNACQPFEYNLSRYFSCC